MSRPKAILLVAIIAALLVGAVFLVIILKGDDILIVPQEYASISEAMAKAKEGYTVLLRSGNYNENIILKSGVTLKGEEGQEVVISCENSKAAITVQDCNNVVIENIAVEYIENDTTEPNDGIFIKDSNVRILTCQVEKGRNGIKIDGNCNVEISKFTGNNNRRFGVFASNGASVSVSKSVFEDNGLTGLAAFGGRELRIENCISSGHKHGGFESKNTECTFIKDSRATENDWGIGIYAKKPKYQTRGSYAEVIGTTTADNNDYGISISGREVAVIEDNISINNGGSGIRCYKTKEAPDTKYADKVQMVNNVSTGNGKDGISVSNIKTAQVRDNISYCNARFGFACYQTSDEAAEGTVIDFEGNVAASNGRDGISCSKFSAMQVWGNHCRGNREYGVGLISTSQARVETNICEDNGDCGMTIQKVSGQATLANNTCRQNIQTGIWVTKSDNCIIENNNCESNNTGISISEITNTAIVNSNRCSENMKHGINSHNVKETYVFDNECRNNKKHGIQVWSDKKNKSNEIASVTETLNNKQAIAKVYSNRCSENKQYGIYCHNIKGAEIFENECSNNKKNGIVVWTEKKKKTDENALDTVKIDKKQTIAKVYLNSCTENEEYGIWCSRADEVVVFENECTLNQNSGILISSDTEGKIRGNVCRENFHQGIYLYKINREIEVEGNECRRNGRSGLRLCESSSSTVSVTDNEFSENFNYGMSIAEGGKAKVVGNMCEYNRYEGLYTTDEGTEVDAVNNTFKGNYATGILYCKGAAGAIDSNICVNHPWSGITIRDKETRVLISNNTIGGNDCWGIAYLKGGSGELRDNIFQGNGIGSIRTEGGGALMTPFQICIYLHLPVGLMMQL